MSLTHTGLVTQPTTWEQLFHSTREGPQNRSTARVLLVAAHPDDETIGAGVLISRININQIHLVHVTDGSPRNPSDALAAGFSSGEAYAAARRAELIRSLAVAGIDERAMSRLDFTDQELSFQLEDLTARILAVIEERKPDVVLAHAYEGGHPDHDAVAFACHVARQLFTLEYGHAFELVEFTGYYSNSGRINVGDFLPGHNEQQFCCSLAPHEKEMKRQMLRAFKSQSRTLEPFFTLESEKLRRAPAYDFSRPPHEGTLFYEYFPWGVNGEEWRSLAHKALIRLTTRRGSL
jgi:LmbE family N-acetylglucosaminyl deacetylase